ncbi:MAG: 2-octaprenyl-6-methoxyphenyl hydroxylase [Gammaproteobacteria bacterium]|nr:MAG: 2-octaprenyl-6-methoxyphenyl hydroxylase [Gammaproteobacteria bacterium]
MKAVQHEICIVGGGMVGAPLAIVLAQLGFDVALVEAKPPHAHCSPSFDDRCLALSHGSISILSALGLWSDLQSLATPIHDILVCEQQGLGQHRISSKDRGVSALGEVISARSGGEVMWRALQAGQASVYAPMSLNGLRREHNIWQVQLNGTEDHAVAITAELVIAADGQHSRTRTMAGIEVSERHYGQSAVIANVRTDQPHESRALELFRPDGPLALLPFSDHWSLVYTIPDERLAEALSWEDETFLAQLQAEVGWRYGKFLALSERRGYPLRLTLANRIAVPGLWLAGNAAHSIHPIAGQGFNLGLRDVAWIVELLLWARHQGLSLSGPELAEQYCRTRKPDIARMATLTDWLARGFRPQLPGAKMVRSLLLSGLGLCPLADEWVARTAMGQQPPVPWLAAGLSLEEVKDEVTYGCSAAGC